MDYYFLKKNSTLSNNFFVDYEECIIIQFANEYMQYVNDKIKKKIRTLLSNYNLYPISSRSFIDRELQLKNESNQNINKIINIGPRPAFKTSWCSNVIDVFKRLNINIERIEIFKRYLVNYQFNDYELLYDKMTEEIYDDDFFTKKNKNNIYETFSTQLEESYLIDVNDLQNLNESMGLSLDNDDIEYYKKIFGHRKLTNVELYDLSQSNSEHSRHWFFNGKYSIYKPNNYKNYTNNYVDNISLLKKIKSTNIFPLGNSLIAFKDNASSINGFNVKHIVMNNNCQCLTNIEVLNPTHTAETHNFPTGICPFPGASTGTGGRIRDQISIGRGGNFISGYVGYSVGKLFNTDDEYPFKLPEDILIEASNGASDYGNKIGEPVTLGYTRSFGMKIDNQINSNSPILNDENKPTRYEYVKPIMYSGGIGILKDSNVSKKNADLGYLVVRVGGPAYNIGLGGGSASSRNQDSKNEKLDFNAVQRGDPQMENKVSRFVEICNNMDYNPIITIHDQGSGGMGNVTKEIMYPNGGIVSLNNVKLGEPNLSSNVIWNAEYQEQCTILINPRDTDLIKSIAKRENINLEFIGLITNSKKICVYNKNEKEIDKVVNFNLEEVLETIPRKVYHLYENINKNNTFVDKPSNLFTEDVSIDSNNNYFINKLESVLKSVNVGSKRFLTTKVDRSVSGLIAQQQCIGPFHLPLSNYSITSMSYFGNQGIVASIGEQPLKGIIDNKSGIEMSIGEMLTNIIFVKITKFTDIKCLGNWMWSPKLPGQGYLLYEAGCHSVEVLKKLNLGVDGGKDSLSMNTKIKNDTVISPNTYVISSYVCTDNFNLKLTPDIKKPNTNIVFVDLAYGNCRLGGSQYCQEENNFNYESPKFENIEVFPFIFNVVQDYIKDGKLLSGHDRSDGGLITTLVEMSISSHCGLKLNIDLNKIDFDFKNNFFVRNGLDFKTDIDYLSYFFNEELGLVFEIQDEYLNEFMESINYYCPCYLIGRTMSQRLFELTYNNKLLIRTKVVDLWNIWEETSFRLEEKQCNIKCVNDEKNGILLRMKPCFNISDKLLNLINELEISNSEINSSLLLSNSSVFSSSSSESSLSPPINVKILDKSQSLSTIEDSINFNSIVLKSIKIGIVREEGSNGDKEMSAAFILAGFDVFDITMNDIIESKGKLINNFNGLAFVGGFSFSDVMGSSVGWSASILFNDDVNYEFNKFYNDESKFSLGVCNGCQLMSLIGFIPKVRLIKNKSERFESRCVQLKIYKNSNNIFLKDMEDTIFNMWSAHGEGQFVLCDDNLHDNVRTNGLNKDYLNMNSKKTKDNLFPIRYVNDMGNFTEEYPFNPNGSIGGVAAVSSYNSRHLAIMPHPERCFLKWQLPYIPEEYNNNLNYFTPWMYLFVNAYKFCNKNN